MMAVSMMHMETVQETAQAKLGRMDDSISVAGKLAAISGKVTQARNEVVETELQATDQQLSLIGEFQSRYVDNATVNESDNDRFSAMESWAAARGIALESTTKTIEEEIQVEIEVEIEETDPDTGKTTTRTETQTQTQTITREVYDLDAIAANQASLEAYKANVVSGQADNPILQNLLLENELLQEAEQQLADLGYNVDVQSLGELKETLRDVRNWTSQLLAKIEEHVLAAKVVYQQLTSFSENWTETNQDAADLSAKQNEKSRAYGLMEQAALKLIASKSDQMNQIIAALGDAIQETEKLLTELKATI